MTFINTETKIGYYLLMVFHTMIGILIFSSFFFIQDLKFPMIFMILFFGSFFMQTTVVSLIILLYYSFAESQKNKIIRGMHINYVWQVNLISVLPLEFGIAILIGFGYSLSVFLFAFLSGFVLLFFFYQWWDPDIHFPELEPTEKKPSEEEEIFDEILRISNMALDHKNQGSHEEALKLYKEAWNMLLNAGFDRRKRLASFTRKIKLEIIRLEYLLDND